MPPHLHNVFKIGAPSANTLPESERGLALVITTTRPAHQLMPQERPRDVDTMCGRVQFPDYLSPRCAVRPCIPCPAGSLTASLRTTVRTGRTCGEFGLPRSELRELPLGCELRDGQSMCLRGSHGQRSARSRVTGIPWLKCQPATLPASNVSLHLHSSSSKVGWSVRKTFVHESIKHSLISAQVRAHSGFARNANKRVGKER